LLPRKPRPAFQGKGSQKKTSSNTEDDAPSTSEIGGGASLLQKVTVTFQLAGINFAASATNGLIVVGLPRITTDLSLPDSLAFWPHSVGSLATASTLLLAGSAADILGPRTIDTIGTITLGALMIGCGFSRTGEDLVGMRAVHGVALAMHLASSVALITRILPRGRPRNVAFSCLGLSQPLGFSVGLVLGGVFIDTIGWRAGWYIYGGFTLLLAVMGLFTLPKGERLGTWGEIKMKVKEKVDWVGALLASSFMALLCYFLA
jgi:MFS family permease